MELPARFRDLPAWATVLGALLGLLVVLTGLSMVLGIVFAGIAVGAELGSATIGVLAALLGLAIVAVPAIALVLAARGGGTESDTDRGASLDGTDDPVDALRERYLAGEIDEATLERRIDESLAESDERTASTASETDDGADETTSLTERER